MPGIGIGVGIGLGGGGGGGGGASLTASASSFLASASTGALIAALSNPFQGATTYEVVGATPSQLALSGASVTKAAGAAAGGQIYSLKVRATSADGKREVAETLSFTALAGSTVSISDASATEGDSGSVAAIFTVSRSGGTAAFDVSWATVDGTAIAGTDYVAAGAVLPFGVGETSKTITVQILGDTVSESTETFFVDLSAPTNGTTLGTARGTCTISDNDIAPPAALFSRSDNFNGGNRPLNDRPGWTMFAEASGSAGDTITLAGVLDTGLTRADMTDGRNNRSLFGDDLGRFDGGYVETTVAAASSTGAHAVVNYVDNGNLIRFTHFNTTRFQVAKLVNTTITNLMDTGATNPTVAVGDKLRLEWEWDATLSNLTLRTFKNGIAWPTATANSTTVSRASLGFGPSSRCGLIASKNDDYKAGLLGSAFKPRLTMAPLRKIYQRRPGTNDSAVSLSGISSGVTGIEFRLLKAGVVVSGWDWGQKALTGLVLTSGGIETAWSAKTPPVPQGLDYTIEVRATNDTMAGSNSWPFTVGAIILVGGQSNGTGLAISGIRSTTSDITTVDFGATTTEPAVALPNGRAFGLHGRNDTSQGSGTDAGVLFAAKDAIWNIAQLGLQGTNAGNILASALANAPADLAIAVVPFGKGASALARFLPADNTIWPAIVQQIDNAGGDVEAVIFAQGEEDAGRSNTGNIFTASAETTYRQNLLAFRDAILAKVNRTAAQMPFIQFGLGRMATTATGPYAADPSYDRFRRMQWDIAEGPGAVPGIFFAGNGIDLPMRDEAHYGYYTEICRRIGEKFAQLMGWQTTSRAGPIANGVSRSGMTLTMNYNMNGATALTCAASIATNFAFADSGGAAKTPTQMTTNVTGTAGTVTFTFGEAVGAGWSVKSPNGIKPDHLNVLKGTYPDGRGVMTRQIYDALVAA